MSRTALKSPAVLVIISLLWMNLTVPAAQATMVGTEKVFNNSRDQETRTRIISLLERQEVQKALETHGIGSAGAKARIDALSEAEVQRIAEKLDQLPAGGDGVGAVIGALVIIFLVLGAHRLQSVESPAVLWCQGRGVVLGHDHRCRQDRQRGHGLR